MAGPPTGYGGGYGSWSARGNEEVKKQNKPGLQEKSQKGKPAKETFDPFTLGGRNGASNPFTGPPTARQQEIAQQKQATFDAGNLQRSMLQKRATEGRQLEMEMAKAGESTWDRLLRTGSPVNEFSGLFDPMGQRQAQAKVREKAKRRGGPRGNREMTDAEFRALPRKQRQLIEFNTEVADLQKAKDTAGLDKLFKDLNIKGISQDEFRQGRSIITDEDLWGTGKKAAPDKLMSTMPVPEGPLERVTKDEAVDFADRQKMIDNLSAGIAAMFKRRDASDAMKMDAVLGQDNVNRAQGGALGGEPSDFGKQLKLNGEQEALLAQMVERTAMPSMWKAGGSHEAIANTLNRAGISMEQWANYAGTVAAYRHQQGRPLSGDAKDSFDIDQYMTQLGLKRQGK